MTRQPAGFWIRYCAYFIDFLILSVASYLPVLLVMPFIDVLKPSAMYQQMMVAMTKSMTGDLDALWAFYRVLAEQLLVLSAVNFLVYAVLAIPYFVWMESSTHQASIGKRCAGLKAVASDGSPLSSKQAWARTLLAGLSWITLNVGHALCAWRKDKRTLHDLLAGTQVVYADQTPPKFPVWGMFIVGLSALALVLTMLSTVLVVWWVQQFLLI